MPGKSLFVRIRQRRTARYHRLRREEWSNRVIARLMNRESEAETLEEIDHWKFCRRVVALALSGWPEPDVAAYYYHYGRHPDKLIPEWLQRGVFAESLGPSLADLLKDRNYIPSLLVPDYDPTIPIRRPAQGLAPVYQMSASGWPDQQDIVRDPQEEEHRGQPRIPRPSLQGMPRFGGSMVICFECQNPAVEGKGRCHLHLKRAREASKRSRTHKRLLLQAQALAMPHVAGLARLLADIDKRDSGVTINS